MVTLRPIQASDFPLLQAAHADSRYAEFFRRFPPFYTWGRPEVLASSLNGTSMIMVKDKEAGLITLANFDQQARKAELGIVVFEEEPTCSPSLRREIAFQATKIVGDYAFNYLGLNKMYCLVLSHRKALKAFLTSMHWHCEGRLRDNCYFQGRFWDEDSLSLTRKDYDKHSELH